MFPDLNKSGALQCQGSGSYSLRCFCLCPHDDKMAAIVPHVISSYNNIQKQKRMGSVSLPTCVHFYQEEKSFPKLPNKLPLLSYRSELGHMPHPTPSSVIDKGLPRLFSLTVIQPMEPRKETSSPEHSANYLNS